MKSVCSTVHTCRRLSSTLVRHFEYTAHLSDIDDVIRTKALEFQEKEPENSEEGYREMFLLPKSKLHSHFQIDQLFGVSEEEAQRQCDIVDRIAEKIQGFSENRPRIQLNSPNFRHSSTNNELENRPSFRNFAYLEPVKSPKFLHKAPNNIQRRLKYFKRKWVRQQFGDALQNGTEAEAKALLDKFLQNEQVTNADQFLEELVRHKLKKSDFGNAFTTWSNYANTERTVAGVDQLLEHILHNDKEMVAVQQSRIKRICDLMERIFTSSVAFAECVSAYLMTGKYEEAKILAKYYVISPRSFIDAVRRLNEKGDIQSIELFARLFTEIYFDDINVASSKAEKSEALPATEEIIELELSAKNSVNFLLQAPIRKKKFKYMAKKPKVRKYEVDHRQLDILINALIESWIDVADVKNNVKTLDNMHYFIEQNKIFIRNSHLDFLEQILERNGIEENPFKEHAQKF